MGKKLKKIVIANWKMNLNYFDSLSLARKIGRNLEVKRLRNEAVILPDFLALPALRGIIKQPLQLGSQDVAAFPLGAYTGEVSLESLAQLACSYSLIGHSERRRYFFDDNLVADKVKNVLANSQISPILCLGETWRQRKAGRTKEALAKQLQSSLAKLSSSAEIGRILIAYEPVWAIGTGRAIAPSEAAAVHKEIKSLLAKTLRGASKAEVRIIYGGSVNLANYAAFKKYPEISGLLIGGASLKADDFLAIAYDF